MSIQKNLAGLFVPVREQRQTVGTLTSIGSEIVHIVNGDDSAIIYINAAGTSLNATLEFTGTVDGTNYFALPVVPYIGIGGTIPSFAQPLITDAFAGVAVQRAYCVKTSQLSKIRLRFSAYSAGSVDVTINSDANRSIHSAISDGRPTTLYVGATAAVGIAATATLPLVAGLRHYIDFIAVQRVASAALTAGAGTTAATVGTNLPTSFVGSFVFGQDAALQGTVVEVRRDFGGTGLAVLQAGTATVLTMPATTGVIWRIEIAYRLGI